MRGETEHSDAWRLGEIEQKARNKEWQERGVMQAYFVLWSARISIPLKRIISIYNPAELVNSLSDCEYQWTKQDWWAMCLRKCDQKERKATHGLQEHAFVPSLGQCWNGSSVVSPTRVSTSVFWSLQRIKQKSVRARETKREFTHVDLINIIGGNQYVSRQWQS